MAEDRISQQKSIFPQPGKAIVLSLQQSESPGASRPAIPSVIFTVHQVR
jgi:hypothetical protein